MYALGQGQAAVKVDGKERFQRLQREPCRVSSKPIFVGILRRL